MSRRSRAIGVGISPECCNSPILDAHPEIPPGPVKTRSPDPDTTRPDEGATDTAGATARSVAGPLTGSATGKTDWGRGADGG